MSAKRLVGDEAARLPFTFDPAFFTELPVGSKLDLSRLPTVLRLPNGRLIVLVSSRQVVTVSQPPS